MAVMQQQVVVQDIKRQLQVVVAKAVITNVEVANIIHKPLMTSKGEASRVEIRLSPNANKENMQSKPVSHEQSVDVGAPLIISTPIRTPETSQEKIQDLNAATPEASTSLESKLARVMRPEAFSQVAEFQAIETAIS